MEALIARGIQILIALGGAYVLTLWFAVVVWTFQDIQARSRSVVAQIFSTLVVMIFSIPGLLVYMILRPRYTLDDAFQRSLEEEYLLQDLEELPLCAVCQQYVEDDWVYCPNCRTELRDNCVACDRLIDLRWEICPYCGTAQYPEDDAAFPQQPAQPVLTPSPQFLGQPQLSQAQARELAGNSQRTRPVIPATVRVDFESGDVNTEQAPRLSLASKLSSLARLDPPRRVSLSGNGATDTDGREQVRNEAQSSAQQESHQPGDVDGPWEPESRSEPEPIPTPRKSKKRGRRRRNRSDQKESPES